ncbi:hypothetical protein CDAR_53831 [Caerostris darwini]|uniref:Uncharacterized protein n=1 Tax=Caerostris darwini TaxID=1538125 RepID=A0AAV4X1J8_9ARAC|nr:hypothetical protein CDAR_53831 [Caerostris darwini]
MRRPNFSMENSRNPPFNYQNNLRKTNSFSLLGHVSCARNDAIIGRVDVWTAKVKVETWTKIASSKSPPSLGSIRECIGKGVNLRILGGMRGGGKVQTFLGIEWSVDLYGFVFVSSANLGK